MLLFIVIVVEIILDHLEQCFSNAGRPFPAPINNNDLGYGEASFDLCVAMLLDFNQFLAHFPDVDQKKDGAVSVRCALIDTDLRLVALDYFALGQLDFDKHPVCVAFGESEIDRATTRIRLRRDIDIIRLTESVGNGKEDQLRGLLSLGFFFMPQEFPQVVVLNECFEATIIRTSRCNSADDGLPTFNPGCANTLRSPAIISRKR